MLRFSLREGIAPLVILILRDFFLLVFLALLQPLFKVIKERSALNGIRIKAQTGAALDLGDLQAIHIHTILHQNKGDENARGHIGTELNNKAETVLLVEKDKSNGDISNVSAMHIRAMDFEPFAFRINDNALPELIEGYRPEAKKPGRPEEEKFDPYRHITEQQHRIALEAAFGLKEEYGYKDLETALIKSYMSVGVKLNHQKAVSLITMLRNKRMIVQENGRKYTFKPDFHY